MELSVIKNPDLVVALDVGSTYSGYAWQWRGDFESNKGNVAFNTNWGLGAPQLHKTNTSLLLRIETQTQPSTTHNDAEDKPSLTPNKSSIGVAPHSDPSELVTVVAFGYTAEHKYRKLYSEEKSRENKENFYLFTQFKLQLYQLENRAQTTRDRHEKQKTTYTYTDTEDVRGRHYSLFHVLSYFIGELKNHFLKRHGHSVNQDTLLWVLTVPSLWSEYAKQFMREAAEQCGISRRHLLLASEAEAAAICGIHLPVEERRNTQDFSSPGSSFLAVDIGGGTADLSAFEVQKGGLLKELANDQGVMAGGQMINDAFFQACHDTFEGSGWQEVLTDATPMEMMEMNKEFESVKVSIGNDDPVDEIITLTIPAKLKKLLKKEEMKIRKGADDIVTKDGQLMFRSDYIRNKLFAQPCKLVFDELAKMIEHEPKITTVVLVGGFSESLILIKYVEEALSKRFPGVKLFVPTSPFRAVLKGAVLYGHDFRIIASRICRATYGVEVNVPFKEKVHDPSKKFKNPDTGMYMCRSVLHVHVRKGERIVLDTEQTSQSYKAISCQDDKLHIELYETLVSRESVIYTTDPRCKWVGEIEVDIGDRNKDGKAEVQVSLIYGGSQLDAIAKCPLTNRTYCVHIKLSR